MTKGVTTRSLFFGPTPPRTKTQWTLIDTRPSSLKSVELYQLSQEESSPTKLIISAALSQEDLSKKFSRSWSKSRLESTKLLEGTQTSKKDYAQEDTTKLLSTSRNKPLIHQSRTDTRRPILMTPSKSPNTYPTTSTKTNFITTRNTDTSTTEEYSQDSLSQKESTAFGTNHFSTRRSKQDPIPEA